MPEQNKEPFVFNAERNAQQIEELRKNNPGKDVTHAWTGEQLNAILQNHHRPSPEELKQILADIDVRLKAGQQAEDTEEEETAFLNAQGARMRADEVKKRKTLAGEED